LNLFAFNPTSYGVLLQSENATGNPFTGHYYAVSVTDAPPGDPVPELSTCAMLGLGFAGLALVAARRRKTPVAALG
jgi:MYXO-CTERM domain-containing protein